MTEEKLLILPLNDETSKKISQVLANETSRKILEALCDAPLSSLQISERLNLPLNTLHYNIENLLETGLIKVEDTRYSEKGREIKIYAPTRKFIVIAPEVMEKEKVKATLRKALFGVYFLLAAVFSGYGFQRVYYSFKGAAPLAMKAIAPAEKAPMAERAVETTVQEEVGREAVITGEPNLYLWFLFGAIFALVLLFVWKKVEGRIKWKRKG